ncbi:hypothetical protein [Dietzia sp. 179-F 9C3 NHS]|uniref:hypothetical protein n=1 Tax=Dietzia sp. 179-F 9C3 NHS TaxID=3374295 RepID=UPI0038791ED1
MFDILWPHELAAKTRDDLTALAGDGWDFLAAMPLNPATIALSVFLAGVALVVTDGVCRRLAALLNALVAPLSGWAQRKAIGAAATAPYRRITLARRSATPAALAAPQTSGQG